MPGYQFGIRLNLPTKTVPIDRPEELDNWAVDCSFNLCGPRKFSDFDFIIIINRDKWVDPSYFNEPAD